MQSQARAVVIGGGVVGVSTLYHLARKGWTDAVLLERKELTSGSTWHAAGLLPLFNMSYSVGQIHKYSVRFYQELQKETGMNVGFTNCSNIRLARTRDRWDEFMYYAGIAETIDVPVRLLTPEQLKEVWPLCETDGILGAIQHPDDGYIQPADLTQALAKGARDRGATIHRNTAVTAIEQAGDGKWRVVTDKGDIVADHVVSCTGNFARRTGAMVGLNVPVIPVEHQYIVTEPHPAIVERKKQGLPEMGVLRESDSSWYMREENGGLLLGPYEKGAPACYVDGPSDDSEYELFQEDLERLMPHIEAAIVRVPAFGEVGIKKVYNGAIAYTPDGSPIVGPAPGLKNFWLNEGHSFGVTAAGGAGWQIAEWIVDGEPTIDMMGVDPRRFGPYATEGYLKEKNEEAYANVFTMHYPDEERAAARPLKTTPVLLPHEGTRRRVRLGLRLGAAELVRSRRLRGAQGGARRRRRRVDQREPCAAAGGWPHRREVVVPPLQLFRPCRQRGPQRHRQCGPAGHVGLCQSLGRRRRRGGLAGVDPRQPHPQKGRAHCALPPAHPAWRRQERVHRLPAARRLLSGLRRCLRGARPRRPAKAPAGRRQRQLFPGHHAMGRAGSRRSEQPQGARQAHAHAARQCELSLGCPASRSRSAQALPMRSGSTSSASSAGSSIIRSSSRPTSSTG